jgi:uncharacterized membrane protein
MRGLASSGSTTARAFTAVAGLLAVLTLVGIVALWPGSDPAPRLAEQLTPARAQAEVLGVVAQACNRPQGRECRLVQVRLLDGDLAGGTAGLVVGEDGAAPRLGTGDRVVVVQDRNPRTQQLTGEYRLADPSRRSAILWLALGFAALVVAFGRWRGALSLVGVGVSLVVVLQFMLPALLAGRPAVLVALVGSLAVMGATLLLAHGAGPKTLAAGLGIAGALVLTVGLAVLFTELANLTGFAAEEARAVRIADRELSLQGLVIAGMVIAALGVLDDIAVAQASTVMALRRANPAMDARRLFREALEVGRDHVSALVNTLVLAYVGASLPLLLLFSVSETGAGARRSPSRSSRRWWARSASSPRCRSRRRSPRCSRATSSPSGSRTSTRTCTERRGANALGASSWRGARCRSSARPAGGRPRPRSKPTCAVPSRRPPCCCSC